MQDCHQLQYFPSFLYPYSHIDCSILVHIAIYKYHCLAPHRIIRSSRQPQPPFYLSCVQFLSFSFPIQSTLNQHHLLLTNDMTYEPIHFNLLLISNSSQVIPRLSIPTGGRTINNCLSASLYSPHHTPHFGCCASSIDIHPS